MNPKHYRVPNIYGQLIDIDPNVEPLVQPVMSGFLQVWNLEGFGKSSCGDPKYHVIMQYARLDDAKLIHDMLMEGKISWRQVPRTIIERGEVNGLVV